MRNFGLRERLALNFAVGLTVVVLTLSAMVTVLVHRTFTRSIDAQLATFASATRAIIADQNGRVSIDAGDRTALLRTVGENASELVRTSAGDVLIATVAEPPRWLSRVVADMDRQRFTTVETATGDVRVLATPLQSTGKHRGQIVVWESLSASHAFERALIFAFIIAGLCTAVLAYAIGWDLARRGLAPLRRIARVASDIEAHDLSMRLHLPNARDELGMLTTTFDRMLDRLQTSFESQRRFTADASHELRAPLASLHAEAELALRRERSPQAYRDALSAILSDAARLETLIESLLFVARSDAGAVPLCDVDLADVAQGAMERIDAFARARRVRLRRELQSAVVTGNAELLERALLAVLHNAIKFSPPEHDVLVRIAAAADSVVVEIADAGAGFSPEALTSALDRFWRDDAARSGSATGLGLSIVQAAVARCGGSASLHNAEPGGAVVRLRFPQPRHGNLRPGPSTSEHGQDPDSAQ